MHQIVSNDPYRVSKEEGVLLWSKQWLSRPALGAPGHRIPGGEQDQRYVGHERTENNRERSAPATLIERSPQPSRLDCVRVRTHTAACETTNRRVAEVDSDRPSCQELQPRA